MSTAFPNHLLHAAILTTIFIAAPARASDFEQCAGIAADAERLACYDRASGRSAPSTSNSAIIAERPVESSQTEPAPLGDGISLSMMQKAWDLKGTRSDNFEIRPYRAIYLLPLFASSRTNPSPHSPTHPSVEIDGIRAREAKFQISFKTKIATDLFGDNGDLWLGYTQSSRWQVYSGSISRPFRETNYEPEAMFIWRTDLSLAGIDLRYLGLTLSHQSNGRGGDLSRSWNRLIAQAGFEKDDWAFTFRGWHRIREDSSSDDNPDIEKYLGRGEVEIARKIGNQLLMAQIHHPLSRASDSKGSIRLDWAFPISKSLRGHLQAFSGYGESLVDYNHKANYIGVGISLAEPF